MNCLEIEKEGKKAKMNHSLKQKEFGLLHVGARLQGISKGADFQIRTSPASDGGNLPACSIHEDMTLRFGMLNRK